MNSNGSDIQASVSVQIQQVSKLYETREGEQIVALDSTDIVIKPGEFVAVVGPSGCGKSTLLSLVAGLAQVSSGCIYIDGDEVKRAHPKIGMVFQSDLLLYWRSVLDNILLPLEIKKRKRSDYVGKAEELLAQVGLSGFGSKYPAELSGGMRQRVAICRALIQMPGLLLMDEPFGALDALTREQMILDLQTLWLSVNNTVIFITHGIDEAVFLADRVLVMSPRPGRIDLDLRIDLPRPRSPDLHGDPRFNEYLLTIRRMFESKGVLHRQH